MTETEYITATNRVKVSLALVILQDILPGDKYGISNEEVRKVRCLLTKAQDKLFKSYDLEGK